MRLLPRRRRRPSENVVPLINVVFLLLVFFMLAGRLAGAPPLEVALPDVRAAASPPAGGTRAPVLTLGAQGELFLDEAPLSHEALGPALRERRPRSLLLRADARAPARVLLPLLEELDEAGVEQLDLVTRLAR